MKKIGVILIAVFCLLLINSVSARLSISDVNEVYNLGDKIYITLNDIRGSSSGNLNLDLVCGEQKISFLKISSRAFSLDGTQSYSLPYKILTKEDLELNSIDNLTGSCYLTSYIGNEQVSTKTFEISNKILVDATVDKINYDPGETIILNINAKKANGDLLEGFVEASNATDFSKAITSGYLIELFAMPENAESGEYILSIRAYDSGNLNTGEGEVRFSINQIPYFIETALSVLEVIPGEGLTIGPVIYDQSGKEMDGNVEILIVSPDKKETYLNVKSKEFATLDFEFNAMPGTWKIYSSFEDIKNEEELRVLEMQKVAFEFEGAILIIKNIGNVAYNKSINIDIGGKIINLDLNIGVGENRKFNLKAPDGEYDVNVFDDTDSSSSRVALTGNAISIRDLKESSIFNGYSIIWVFLILILLGVGAIFFIRFNKTRIRERNYASRVKKGIGGINNNNIGSKMVKNYSNHVSRTMNFTNKSPESQSFVENEDKHGMLDFTKEKIGKAEPSLVVSKGEKHLSSVVAIRVRNHSSLDSETKKRLFGILASVKENKGLVDWRGDYIFIIFSPLSTHTVNNELLAVKSGFEIFEKLNYANKKFRTKVEFNIGITSGELVVSKEAGKLKYTSTGNTMAMARRLADTNRGKLLVSEDVRRKLLRDLKVESGFQLGRTRVYEVSKLKDKEANQDKLDELLKRMGG